MKNQEFGGVWTEAKLKVIENYLNFYTIALKRQNFKLCYIDAFAGSGNIELNDGTVVDGSAIRALKYSFDNFLFAEKDPQIFKELESRIKNDFADVEKKVTLKNQDCNDVLMTIDKKDWINQRWRGVIFLDPFAMQLSWECLEKISNTKALDVWYLFPFSAVNRNLYKNKRIPEANKKKINKILGTSDWERVIYKESSQLTLFNHLDYEKEDTEGLKNYILERLRSVFPTVSDKAVLLRNVKNSPCFLLCFAGSNPSLKAKELSLKVADHLLNNI